MDTQLLEYETKIWRSCFHAGGSWFMHGAMSCLNLTNILKNLTFLLLVIERSIKVKKLSL